jgi:hypothetical protein
MVYGQLVIVALLARRKAMAEIFSSDADEFSHSLGYGLSVSKFAKTSSLKDESGPFFL